MQRLYKELGERQGHYTNGFESLSSEKRAEYERIAKERTERAKIETYAQRENRKLREAYSKAGKDSAKLMLLELKNLSKTSDKDRRKKIVQKIQGYMDEAARGGQEKSFCSEIDATDGQCALHRALSAYLPTSLVKRISDANPDAHQIADVKGRYPLHFAAKPEGLTWYRDANETTKLYNSNVALCLDVWSEGAKKMTTKYPYETPLHRAAKRYAYCYIKWEEGDADVTALKMLVDAYPYAAKLTGNRLQDANRKISEDEGKPYPPMKQIYRNDLPINICAGKHDYEMKKERLKAEVQELIQKAQAILVKHSPDDWNVQDSVCTSCVLQ